METTVKLVGYNPTMADMLNDYAKEYVDTYKAFGALGVHDISISQKAISHRIQSIHQLQFGEIFLDIEVLPTPSGSVLRNVIYHVEFRPYISDGKILSINAFPISQ